MIKDLPENERPRERLERYGAEALACHELLAILLHTGTSRMSAIEIAENIFREIRDPSGLRDKTIHELAAFRGVGKAKAITILAALELGKRALQETREFPKIVSSEDVFRLVHDDLSDLKQEVLLALYLDLKNRLIAKKTIFIGGLNQSLVHPREVFKYAVKYSAYAVLLVHNHPSGDPEPSRQDLEVTDILRKAGELMQIPLVDHIVVGKDRYRSINEYGQKKSGRGLPPE